MQQTIHKHPPTDLLCSCAIRAIRGVFPHRQTKTASTVKRRPCASRDACGSAVSAVGENWNVIFSITTTVPVRRHSRFVEGWVGLSVSHMDDCAAAEGEKSHDISHDVTSQDADLLDTSLPLHERVAALSLANRLAQHARLHLLAMQGGRNCAARVRCRRCWWAG